MKPGDILENGYKVKTTFWDDFTIAETFGVEAIKETYGRMLDEWKTNYIFLTELVLILNWKIWHWYKKDEDIARVYNDLWEQTENYAYDHLRGEELKYFIRTID